MLPAANGSLSAACSILVMSIILRLSPESRTSSYHMIVFFMSFWDAVASAFIALNTMPMPTDVYEVYPSLAGEAYGNIGSCEVQGFFIWVGTLFVLCSNNVLCIYYLCTFRYGVREERLKRRVLPFLLVLSIATSVIIPTAAVRTEYMNPSPMANYCSAVAYPLDCDLSKHDKSFDKEGDDDEGITCIRGGKLGSDGYNIFRIFGFVLLLTTFLVLVSALVLVVATIFHAEMLIRRRRRALRSENADGGSPSLETEFKRTKAVLIQAVLYIGAFMFTWIWVVLIVIFNKQPIPILILASFFRPLHGFFSAIIFTYQKVHTLRQTRVELTYFKALKQIIMAPSTVPGQLISRMEVVDEDLEGRLQSDSLILVEDISASERRRLATHNNGMRRLGTGARLNDNNFTPPSSVDSDRDSSLLPSSASSLDEFLSEDDSDNNIEGNVHGQAQQDTTSTITSNN